MKPIARAAFATLLVGTAIGALASSPACAADNKLERDVQIPLAQAQKAIQGNDYKSALADIQQAQAAPDRTPFDDYMINSYLAEMYIQQKDYADAEAPVYATADSPMLPDADKKSTYYNAFQLAVFAKHYQKAIEYGQKLQAMNAFDAKSASNLALAFYFTQDMPHAQQYAQMSIDLSKAAGQTPDENMLKIVMNGEMQQKDTAGLKASLESLAVQYNRSDTWSKLIDMAFGIKGLKDIDELDLLRLKIMIPDIMHPDDYTGLAVLADAEGYATEAVAAVQKGMAAGKITPSQVGGTYTHARNGAAMDARDLSSIATEAQHARTGEADIKLGEDYWGYSRFADVETVAARAISKGGLKDPAEGPMLLGAALVAEGKYAQAVQTFGQVTGNPARMNVAHLWSLYAQAQLNAQGKTAQAQPAAQAAPTGQAAQPAAQEAPPAAPAQSTAPAQPGGAQTPPPQQ